MCQSTLYIAV